MKARALLTATPDFVPKGIQITFETKAELDAFTAVMNYTPVVDALQKVGGFDAVAICDACESVGGEASGPHHGQINQIIKIHPGATCPGPA